MEKIAEKYRQLQLELFAENEIAEIPMTHSQRLGALDGLSWTIKEIYSCVPKEAWEKFEKNLKKAMEG